MDPVVTSALVPRPSLRVQTVLYENDPTRVGRFLESLAAASTLAKATGALSSVTVAIGDCSPVAVFPSDRALDHWRDESLDAIAYLHYDENLGSAGGHNRLFASLESDFAIVCNADTYASPRLFVELLAPFSDETVGIVEARQVPLEQPKTHDPVTGDTSWASGSCFATRAAVVQATGGFDPDLFFLYCDDVDFSWRAKLAGWRVVHRPTAMILHDKRLTISGNLEASDIEVVSGAEAAVLLGWRYSRPDIAERNLEAYGCSSDERHRAAVVRIRARQEADRMPEPLDPDGKVAQFVGVDYATHRFSWAD
jgi:hypothetical protein